VLVVDRDATTLGDQRLLAHLHADEPAGNAALVCRLYLADPRRGRCRALSPADLLSAPTGEPGVPDACKPGAAPRACAAPHMCSAPHGCEPLRHDGRLYRIVPVADRRSQGVQLRWCEARRLRGPWTPLALRELVARFESYEPVCALTAAALAGQPRGRASASGTLHGELRRLKRSPVVLNRGLREAVLVAVEHRGLSLSEIAVRCGKLKRDRQGRVSGQTSWLTRRIGLAPEAGGRRTVRWIHTDVLATIAREGLGVSPREVELG
jgi:hypothetical protein